MVRVQIHIFARRSAAPVLSGPDPVPAQNKPETSFEIFLRLSVQKPSNRLSSAPLRSCSVLHNCQTKFNPHSPDAPAEEGANPIWTYWSKAELASAGWHSI